MKYIVLAVCAFGMHTLYAQDVYRGKVLNSYNQPVEHAQISVNDSIVAEADHYGIFTVVLNEPAVAYIYAEGYEVFETEFTDASQFYTLTITPEADLNEVIISTFRKGTERNTGATNTQTMNSNELLKAACCNLAESFETNPSIDVNFSDAISGSKQIKMLGLTSPYILIAEEKHTKCAYWRIAGLWFIVYRNVGRKVFRLQKVPNGN